jgi:hypothetical protein
MTVPQILNVLWALTALLEVILLILVLRRNLNRTHLPLFIYVFAVIVQSGIIAFASWRFGRDSVPFYNIAWGTQAIVISLRWFAVIDIARKAFSAFPGIWELAIRILFVVTAAALIYSIWSSGDRWKMAVLTADRAEEFCIATFVVVLLLFARYYRLPLNNLERMLAIGFCLYSCFKVITYTVYERLRLPFANTWNYLTMLTFIATVALWIGAVAKYSESPAPAVEPALTPEHYLALSQKLNTRLQLLNDRLDHLFRSGAPRP